jgi:hypothetical protein
MLTEVLMTLAAGHLIADCRTSPSKTAPTVTATR